jgi:excisionase family DNA binding protein
MTVDTEWMTREEAAAYLRVHPATLDRYVRLKIVKRYQVRGLDKRRFRREDLDAAMVPEDN